MEGHFVMSQKEREQLAVMARVEKVQICTCQENY